MLIHIHLSNSLHCQCLSLRTCLTVIYVPAVLSVYSSRCKTTRRLSVMQLWSPKSRLCFIKSEEQSPSLWLNGNKVKLRLIRSCSPTKVTCSVETLPQRFLTFLIFKRYVFEEGLKRESFVCESVCLAYMPDGRSHELFYLTSLVEYFLTDTALFRKKVDLSVYHRTVLSVCHVV